MEKINVTFRKNGKVLWKQNYYSNKAFEQFLNNFESFKKLFERLSSENQPDKLYLINGNLYKSSKSLEALKILFGDKNIIKVKISKIKTI